MPPGRPARPSRRSGPVETALAAIFCRPARRRRRSARHDDFFALGGHSLLATRVAARIAPAARREAAGHRAVRAPTPTALAAFAAQDRAAAGGPAARQPGTPCCRRSPALDRTGPLAPSFAQQRLWFLAQLEGGSEAYHIAEAFGLDGPLDRAALAGALDALVDRHEALRTRLVSVDGRLGPADRRRPAPASRCAPRT